MMMVQALQYVLTHRVKQYTSSRYDSLYIEHIICQLKLVHIYFVSTLACNVIQFTALSNFFARMLNTGFGFL